MKQHEIRERLGDECPVCGAAPMVNCTQLDLKQQRILAKIHADQDNTSEAYFLEFSILRDLKRLKELKPDHELVRVVGAYFKYQDTVKG